MTNGGECFPYIYRFFFYLRDDKVSRKMLKVGYDISNRNGGLVKRRLFSTVTNNVIEQCSFLGIIELVMRNKAYLINFNIAMVNIEVVKLQ